MEGLFFYLHRFSFSDIYYQVNLNGLREALVQEQWVYLLVRSLESPNLRVRKGAVDLLVSMLTETQPVENTL